MKTKITSLVMMGLFLSGCASMVNQADKKDQTGKREVLGEAKFSRSASDCPNGVILAALWHDALNGNDVHFKSASAISSEAIDAKLDLYILSKAVHPGFDKDNDYSKAKLSPPFSSLSVKFLHEKASSENLKALTDAEALKDYKVGQDIGIAKQGSTYFGEGKITEGTLTDALFQDRKLIQSMGISSNGGTEYQYFNTPTSVISTDKEITNFASGISGTVDGELKFTIAPSDEPAALLVQIANDKARGDGITFQYVEPSVEGKSEITVPLKGVAAGSYNVSILRVQNHEAAMGDLNVCVDVASGVRTSLSIAEPKKE